MPLLSVTRPRSLSKHAFPAGDPLVDLEHAGSKGGRDTADAWVMGLASPLQISSLLLYTFVAVAMNFINKYTMVIYPLPNVVLILQMLCSLVIIVPLQLGGLLDFPIFSLTRCRQLFLMTVLYTSNTALALFGLKTLNVPMYSTLKRLTPIMVLVAKVVWTRRLPPTSIIGSVLLVVCGCIVAGCGDLSFNLTGYTFALLSCVLQAMYLVLVELQGAQGISTAEMLYYNALTSLPMLGTIVHLMGDDRVAASTYRAAVAQHGVTGTAAAVLLCASGGILLNFSMFLCTVHNSALTTTLFGVLRGAAIVVLGFFLLGGVRFSWLNVLGISLNLFGGIWYSAIKFNSSSFATGGGGAATTASNPSGHLAGAAAASGRSANDQMFQMGGVLPHHVLLTKSPHMIVSPSVDSMAYLTVAQELGLAGPAFAGFPLLQAGGQSASHHLHTNGYAALANGGGSSGTVGAAAAGALGGHGSSDGGGGLTSRLPSGEMFERPSTGSFGHVGGLHSRTASLLDVHAGDIGGGGGGGPQRLGHHMRKMSSGDMQAQGRRGHSRSASSDTSQLGLDGTKKH